jgi:hypothetical protein
MKKLISIFVVLSTILCLTMFAAAEDGGMTPTVWYNRDVNINFTDTDDAVATAKQGKSGVRELQYQINSGTYTKYTAPFAVGTEGVTTVNLKAIDNAGNESNIATEKVYVDKTKPTGSVSGNPETWCKTATMTFAGTDALSGVKRVSNDGGVTWVTGDTVQLTVNENGTYTFVVEDNAGNQFSVPATVTKIDNLPPNTPIIHIS